MTVDLQHREQQQRPAKSSRDAAREHGNHIAAIADIAEAQLEESEHEREDRNRYEDGLQVLRWLVAADWSERTLEIDRVLHDARGSLLPEKVAEYIGLLIGGMSSLDARHVMAGRQPGRADRMQARADAIEAARMVSANLHRMAEAPPVQPALPPAGSIPPPSNGAVLPRREPGASLRQEPIAPSQPPMYPPAPPETAAQTTGQMLEVLRSETAAGADLVLSPKTIRSLTDQGFGPQPQNGAVPDPGFSPASIPGPRLADTVTMRADEVLAHVAAEDALREMVADGPVENSDRLEPLPFSQAANAALSEDCRPSARRADGDD